MIMFFTSMMMSTFLIIFMKHPLSLGMMLLIQTIGVAMMTGFMTLNFWYSYILFLIMIGGMLILFIYMTSIASNEKFNFSSKMMLIILSMLLLLFTSMILMDYFFINMFNKILDMNLYNNKSLIYISMIKYLNFPNNLILLMMIIYLFITLIAIVKITDFTHGPLRQKF